MKQRIVVGVDIRDLKVAATGQKTFLNELVNQFNYLNDPSVHFIFFSNILPTYKGRNKVLLLIDHFRFQIWKQILLPIKARMTNCDVLFCTDYFVPLVHWKFKSVQVFHDAFFFEYPEHYNKYWLFLYKQIALRASKKSDYIITPSKYAKESIHKHIHIPLERLISIYEGPKNLQYLTSDHLVRSKKITPFIGSKYIFHVGVMEKRKNIPTLLDAFKLCIQNFPEKIVLVLAGKGTGRKESDDTENIQQKIRELELQDFVFMPGYLTDEELSLTYQHALMYVFPSYNEGFGIPVLEAFQAKIPVLVANNSCLPEVGGDAVITFNPFDPQEIAEKIQLVLYDDGLKQTLIEKGLQRLQQFSWEDAAKQMIQVFKKVASEKH